MVQEKPSKTVKAKKGSSSVKVCKNDTSKCLRGILNFCNVLKLITKLFLFPVDRLTHELQALKWEMAREEEQDQESEIDEDFLGCDQDEDEEDDADTIEEEPDFSRGYQEGLSSESAEDSETEDEETQMKSKRYTQTLKTG